VMLPESATAASSSSSTQFAALMAVLCEV
jgi:hypothetical protein